MEWLEQEHKQGSDWWQEVERWVWMKEDDYTWTKSGSCPRCSQQMSAMVQLDIKGYLVAPSPPRGFCPIECNSTGEYDEQPKGVLGCGSYGVNFKLPGQEEEYTTPIDDSK